MRKSVRTATWGVFVALAVFASPSAATAGAISVGDGWHQFSWVGGPNITQVESAFTFSAAGAVTVNVTDAYVAGDRFELYDNGNLVGSTSTINGTPAWTNDPATAFADGGFSKGSFALAAGLHSLVLKNIQIPFNLDSGGAFLSVVGSNGGNGGVAEVSQVPEPGSLALAGAGLAGLALGRFRRRRKEAAAA